MPSVRYELPTFPCTWDMWDELKNEKRPIVVYGMGNGADKLVSRLEKYGVEISDYFASDGFVRGHLFRGKRVKSFSEIKEQYKDFVILLSFASNRPEVLAMLRDINSAYDMRVPDLPVAGLDEYFDREFYNSHYSEIISAMSALADEESKNLFAAIVNYKLTGRAEYLFDSYSTKDELYSLLPCERIESYADLGAYNGDTLAEALHYFPNLGKALLVEPDAKNFKRLSKFSDTVNGKDLTLVNAAAWSFDGKGEFNQSGNRNSTASATASHEHKTFAVALCRLDSLIQSPVDFIKYDVEGAEEEALLGSHETIKKYTPALLVSVYHRSRDVFHLVNILRKKYEGYKLYLRRLYCLPAWETNLIMIKEN